MMKELSVLKSEKTIKFVKELENEYFDEYLLVEIMEDTAKKYKNKFYKFDVYNNEDDQNDILQNAYLTALTRCVPYFKNHEEAIIADPSIMEKMAYRWIYNAILNYMNEVNEDTNNRQTNELKDKDHKTCSIFDLMKNNDPEPVSCAVAESTLHTFKSALSLNMKAYKKVCWLMYMTTMMHDKETHKSAFQYVCHNSDLSLVDLLCISQEYLKAFDWYDEELDSMLNDLFCDVCKDDIHCTLAECFTRDGQYAISKWVSEINKKIKDHTR